MNPTSLGLILVSVVLGAGAQILLRAGAQTLGPVEIAARNLVPVGLRMATQPGILAGVACYAVSLVIWILALARVEVSVAYPMVSIGYAITAVAAWLLLGEQLSVARLAGIGIIIAGVIVVARS